MDIDWEQLAGIESDARLWEARRQALKLMLQFYRSEQDVFGAEVRKQFHEKPADLVVGFAMLSEFMLGYLSKSMGCKPILILETLLEMTEDT